VIVGFKHNNKVMVAKTMYLKSYIYNIYQKLSFRSMGHESRARGWCFNETLCQSEGSMHCRSGEPHLIAGALCREWRYYLT
jgi:hypothetical protein